MFRTITTAVVFAAFLATLHFGLRHVYVNVLLAQQFPIERDRAFAEQNSTRMLLMGNSLMQLDVVPPKDAYCLASFAEGYATTYFRLRDILEQGEQPIEVVLMTLSLYSFRSLMPDDTQQKYWARFVDYSDLIQTTGRPIPLLRDAIRAREFPYASGIDKVFDYLRATSDAETQKRFANVNRDFSQATDQFTQAAAGVNALCNTERTIDGTTADYFSRIVDLCEQYDVRLVLVRFPVTRIHYETMGLLVDFDEWQRVVDERLEDADHVEVLDFMELYFDDYSKFADPLHLNGAAKQAFTDTLTDELSKRGLLPAG